MAPAIRVLPLMRGVEIGSKIKSDLLRHLELSILWG